jgi:hypothetical protein
MQAEISSKLDLSNTGNSGSSAEVAAGAIWSVAGAATLSNPTSNSACLNGFETWPSMPACRHVGGSSRYFQKLLS